MAAQTTARASRAAPPTQRAHPASKGGWKTATDVIAWAQACARDSGRGAAATDEAAVKLYFEIKRSSKVPAGLNKLTVAIAARRELRRCARHLEAAEKSYRRIEGIMRAQSGTARAKAGLDMTK
jgi:hypothetical protein